MTLEQIVFELCKVGLQGTVTAFVAWFAVRWTLSRFKVEKTWERRLGAYADVVCALDEMRLIQGRWADELEGGRQSSHTSTLEYADRYHAARRRFEGTVAVARLLLPAEAATLLTTLRREIETADHYDAWTGHNLEYSLIDDAMSELVAQGRRPLS